jgi:transposase
MEAMKPYSEDLRLRIIKAVRDGVSKSAAARLFGVSLSSIKRSSRIAGRGSVAPRKGRGRLPKLDETTMRLLEEGVKERLAATTSLNDATLCKAKQARVSASLLYKAAPLKRAASAKKRSAWGRWNGTNGEELPGG